MTAVRDEIEAGTFTFKRELEDIHMSVESRLTEIVGPAAGRLHTARSRNDQVATDMKLWVRDTLDSLDQQAADLQRALSQTALKHAGTVMPGFTHLQSAQPVTFGHHCLAYVEMLARDRGRSRDARARLVRLAERGTAAQPVAAAVLSEVEEEWRAHLGERRWRQLREALTSLREITDPYR